MIKNRLAALAAVLVFTASAHAAELEVRSLEDGAQSPEASIDALSWLEGRWLGAGLGGKSEEIIAPALGGQIMGMFRQTSVEGELQFYEFFAFAEANCTLEVRLRHFNPDMTAWEDKTSYRLFPLVAIEGETAYFDGITYSLTGADTMEVAVNTGEMGVIRFQYTRHTE
ncbi:MAG: hypothetical protein KDA46_12555 [Parvularculaceae bacterium]|nr:hypothetical protein [Parvularculaceae bacterium]